MNVRLTTAASKHERLSVLLTGHGHQDRSQALEQRRISLSRRGSLEPLSKEVKMSHEAAAQAGSGGKVLPKAAGGPKSAGKLRFVVTNVFQSSCWKSSQWWSSTIVLYNTRAELNIPAMLYPTLQKLLYWSSKAIEVSKPILSYDWMKQSCFVDFAWSAKAIASLVCLKPANPVLIFAVLILGLL